MSFEITRVFTPNYKGTGLKDWRFNEDLQAICQSLEASTIRGLAEFTKKKLELENAYGMYMDKGISLLSQFKKLPRHRLNSLAMGHVYRRKASNN